MTHSRRDGPHNTNRPWAPSLLFTKKDNTYCNAESLRPAIVSRISWLSRLSSRTAVLIYPLSSRTASMFFSINRLLNYLSTSSPLPTSRHCKSSYAPHTQPNTSTKAIHTLNMCIYTITKHLKCGHKDAAVLTPCSVKKKQGICPRQEEQPIMNRDWCKSCRGGVPKSTAPAPRRWLGREF